MSWLGNLVSQLIPAAATSPAGPIAIVKDVATETPAVLTAILNVAQGKARAQDAITIVNAILEGVAFVDPAAAPIITLAIDLEPIALELIASGAVTPGSGANNDPLGRGGRRP